MRSIQLLAAGSLLLGSVLAVPTHTPFVLSSQDLDNLSTKYGDLQHCTVEQQSFLRAVQDDVHRLAVLGLNGYELGSLGIGIMPFEFLGTSKTIGWESTRHLMVRWFGKHVHPTLDEECSTVQVVGEVFTGLVKAVNLTTVDFRYDCNPPVWLCRSMNDTGLSAFLDTSERKQDTHSVGLCRGFWEAPSLRQTLQDSKGKDGWSSPNLPAAYVLLHMLIHAAGAGPDYKVGDMAGYQDTYRTYGGNRFATAQSLALISNCYTLRSADNYAGFALEVAETLFRGKMPLPQSGL